MHAMLEEQNETIESDWEEVCLPFVMLIQKNLSGFLPFQMYSMYVKGTK